MLEARELSVRRGGRLTLSGVTLRLEPGRAVALCGANGAGKSTLLEALCGGLRPDSGGAFLDGADLSRADALQLALRRAVLEQSPRLASALTGRELAELGLWAAAPPPVEARRILHWALEAAGATELAERPANHLSGGERARAHLARVFAQIRAGRERLGPQAGGRWLLLDEPTAPLDLARQIDLMAALRALAAEGVGVVAALHDLNLAAAFADHVVLLAEGRLLAEGPPREVFTEALLTRAYGAPIHVAEGEGGRLRVAPDFARIRAVA
ncbi:ATP-binding cassette domain-containing protein [Neomegalonema perideroedes]|uniref:ATP-binding cassette domain-containing protein n=1 Tax=Neomegalonema perideroedes TaxID=217219 RepID=UPI00035D2813|nr:ATP-binding cassette domain-containing protein [Neomegalonema perideroedes]